ncbi:O-antigen ligase family protein [Spirulina sp. CCNP1310]|uniref:O-antigen ligase family protein n=1 Tax=Spirulina sp. CCNP1310 TaxID=3110249 RepID=UPI002B204E07|nr:O-antigen ligase family protein [Spirulina sp. CCNP1310]MEA5420941.1 O-antigen ligase family protein [Spirulina sp. CCNP1310]
MKFVIRPFPDWFTRYRDHFALILLVGIFVFALLVHVNLPGMDLGAYNLTIPLLAMAILGLYGDRLPLLWQAHRRTLLLLLALYLWFWISAWFSVDRGIAFKFSIKYSIYFFTFPALLILAQAYQPKQRLPWLYGFTLLFLLILAGFGICEHFNPNWPFFPWIRNGTGYYGRALSLLQNPNQLGALMAFGVLLTCTLCKERILPSFSLLFFIPPLIVTLILTGSRNGIFVLLVSGVLMVYPYRFVPLKAWAMALIIPAALATGFFVWNQSPRLAANIQQIPQNITTLQAAMAGDEAALATIPRAELAVIAGQQFLANPITGTGIQTLAEKIMPQRGLTAHNVFLHLLTELGLPGLLLWIGVMVSALWRTPLLDPRVGLLSSFVITAQMFDFFIHDLPTILTMSLMVAIAANFKTNPQAHGPA